MPTEKDQSRQKKRRAVSSSTKRKSASDSSKRLEKYNQVVDSVELSMLSLLNVEYKVIPENISPKGSAKKKFVYHVIPDDVYFDADEGEGVVRIRCEAYAKVGRVKPISCKAIYLVAYDNLFGCEEEAVKAFLRRVGRFSVYPYFRSLFASLNGAAEIPMPPLPVLKEPIAAPTSLKLPKKG